MSEYQSHILHSGKTVTIRPMTWEEYWQHGEERLEISSLMDVINITIEDRKEILRQSRAFREKTLQQCVKNWDEIKGGISFADVVAIERIIDDMSKEPVAEGNLLPAAVITATATKTSIAEPA